MPFSYLPCFSRDASQPLPFCRWVQSGVGICAAGPTHALSLCHRKEDQLSPGVRSRLGKCFSLLSCVWRKLIWR